MAMITDLSLDLIEEILSRVPISSLRAVRSACKGWNDLSKDQSFIKKYSDKAAKEFRVIMFYGSRVSLISVNLHGIFDHEDLVDPSIKKIDNLLNQVEISEVFQCDGLLLCVTRYIPRLVAWNPYLGQVRWIQPRKRFHVLEKFAIGYDSSSNHKILRFWFRYEHITNNRIADCEIYCFKSNLWKVIDVVPNDWDIESYPRSVSLKGNTYFVARQSLGEKKYMLVCFDFTSERFAGHLHLPFDYGDYIMTLSSVREEQLAVLFQPRDRYEIEIWITTKVEPNTVSWRKFFAVKDESILNHLRYFALEHCSFFFIDEEEKVMVVCVKDREKITNTIAYMIREDGCYKKMELGESNHRPVMCSYVPSSVQIHKGPVPARGKRKRKG